ncbi:hypothetical protein GCM10022245_26710 [Streptomyces mayteni]
MCERASALSRHRTTPFDGVTVETACERAALGARALSPQPHPSAPAPQGRRDPRPIPPDAKSAPRPASRSAVFTAHPRIPYRDALPIPKDPA